MSVWWSRTCLPFQSTWCHSQFYVGCSSCLVFLCDFSFPLSLCGFICYLFYVVRYIVYVNVPCFMCSLFRPCFRILTYLILPTSDAFIFFCQYLTTFTVNDLHQLEIRGQKGARNKYFSDVFTT